MDVNQMIENLKNAFAKLMSLRLVASSSSEKIADLPLLLIVIAALMAPRACIAIAVIALATKHSFRVEKDMVMRV